jgi:hypothetical protein
VRSRINRVELVVVVVVVALYSLQERAEYFLYGHCPSPQWKSLWGMLGGMVQVVFAPFVFTPKRV